MTQWIHYCCDEDDTLSYYEIGDDGWALRQVDLRGPDRRPVTAAMRDEVLYIRDHGCFADMVAYETKYGVLAEGSLYGWQEAGHAIEITAAAFEQIWVPARQAVEQDQ